MMIHESYTKESSCGIVFDFIFVGRHFVHDLMTCFWVRVHYKGLYHIRRRKEREKRGKQIQK